MKYEKRRTRVRLVPWIAWNGASKFFKPGLVVSWFGTEHEFTWGMFT